MVVFGDIMVGEAAVGGWLVGWCEKSFKVVVECSRLLITLIPLFIDLLNLILLLLIMD